MQPVEKSIQEAVMENLNQTAPAAEPAPARPPFMAAGLPRKEFYRDDVRYKSPALATIMSAMPGLGQIYVGYYQQGFVNIMVIAGLITLLARGVGNLEPFCALFMAFYWLYNMVDAARKATFYNQSLAGLGPLDLPEGDRMPSGKGSLLGGALLIVAGGIALAHTRFGFSLEWIDRWWPMALVLVGAYLLYQSYASKKQ
jgi:hypothetical protein